jgi:formate--tetrahydrofolate ligase
MAVLCLTGDLMDMKERLGKIIVAFTFHGQPISADHLMAQGAMALLLKEAIKPNLVQTVEGVPAFVHGGPFANIAHGCNSLVATRLALKLSDYVVTEAGFGTDLGAEKFFDIKCRMGNLKPDAVVLVVTARALKRQGGVPKEEVLKENVEALKRGLDNLEKHIENVRIFGVPLVVAINKTVDDSRGEIEAMAKGCKGFGEKAVISEVWEKGGEGGLDLAKEVLSIIEKEPSKFKPLYDLNASIRSKIETIASKIYGADGVDYMAEADRDIKIVEEMGFSKLPVCIAKTQFSLTDDPTKLGRPKGFRINVKRIRASAGAGFLVAYTGDIMTMPGLPPHPAAERIDILPDGKIVGLF